MSDRGKLRRVGAIWKPRAGAKSLGSGTVTINGLRQRFVILKNDRKVDGSRDPDYVLLSSDAPEADEYAREQHAPAPGRQPEPSGATDDDIPF